MCKDLDKTVSEFFSGEALLNSIKLHISMVFKFISLVKMFGSAPELRQRRHDIDVRCIFQYKSLVLITIFNETLRKYFASVDVFNVARRTIV